MMEINWYDYDWIVVFSSLPPFESSMSLHLTSGKGTYILAGDVTDVFMNDDIQKYHSTYLLLI